MEKYIVLDLKTPDAVQQTTPTMNDHINWNSNAEAYKIDLSAVDSEPPSTVISLSVIALTGKAHDEIPPLWDVIDINALDDLYGRREKKPPDDITVKFCYAGFEVVITGDYDLLLRPERTQRSPRAVEE